MRKAIGPGRQRGFLVIAAVFLLVVLAGLVAYLTTLSTTSQAASAADFNAARAYQAARAGIEWGAYQVLRNTGGTFTTNCNGGTSTSNLTIGSFTATVTCTASASITEGASTVRAYRIVSNGCNQPTCPSATTSATYVERELALSITN
jgi:MSHA biogenesis protein MshP